jgi:hypothetical protein
MKVLFFLPLVTPLAGFALSTTSKYAIQSFVGLLTHYKRINKGKVAFIPFKMIREPTVVTYWDESSQSEKTGVRSILYLKPNPQFYELHGAKAQEVMGMLENMKFSLKGVSEEIDNEPMEDHWPALPEGEAKVIDMVEEKKLQAEELLTDPDVEASFKNLETVLGRKFDRKARLQAIRQRENMPDIKAAVLEAMAKKVAEETSKAASQQKAPPAMAKAAEGGIL